MPDDLKLLPDDVRESAIEWMFKANNDPPDRPLTTEKAGQWVDYEVYKQNWHAGRVEPREDNSDHPQVGPHRPTGRLVWPHPEARIGTRDLDANLAVFNALSDAGEDPKTYWGPGRKTRGPRTTREDRTSSSSVVREGGAPTRAGGIIALLVASPFLLVGYAIAALFTTIPFYLVLSALADGYTVVPDTDKELTTAGLMVAVFAGWYFLSGISRALSERSAS